MLLSWATLRQSLQALKHTRPMVITIIVGNVLNAALNWVFVFGHLGSPALGAVGSAMSSVIGRYCMFGLLLVLARNELRPLLRPWRPATFELAPLLRTLRIGLPIGMQNLVEYTTFAAIAVLAGWFGADAIAGHQVALNLASLTFMVPMGMGSAASVLVGHAIGRGEPLHARRVAASALACGAAFMLICAGVLLAIPGVFAHLFTSVPGVAAVAASLIPIAGVFQVFDGLQVIAAGCCAARATRATMMRTCSASGSSARR